MFPRSSPERLRGLGPQGLGPRGLGPRLRLRPAGQPGRPQPRRCPWRARRVCGHRRAPRRVPPRLGRSVTVPQPAVADAGKSLASFAAGAVRTIRLILRLELSTETRLPWL